MTLFGNSLYYYHDKSLMWQTIQVTG